MRINISIDAKLLRLVKRRTNKTNQSLDSFVDHALRLALEEAPEPKDGAIDSQDSDA